MFASSRAALASLAALGGTLSAAGAEPPPCPHDAMGLCGAESAHWRGGPDHRETGYSGTGTGDWYTTDAYLYGEVQQADRRPAAWDEDFDVDAYLDVHAGWNNPVERAERTRDRSPSRSWATNRDAAVKPAPAPRPAAARYRLGEQLIGGRYVVIRDAAAWGLARPPVGHYYVQPEDGPVLLVESATQRIRARIDGQERAGIG